MSIAVRPCARQRVVSGSGTADRPAGRLARLTPQMSGSVSKSFCASRQQTLVMPHLRSQSPTFRVFCLAVVGGDRSSIHIVKLAVSLAFLHRHRRTLLQRDDVVRLAELLQTAPPTGFLPFFPRKAMSWWGSSLEPRSLNGSKGPREAWHQFSLLLAHLVHWSNLS